MREVKIGFRGVSKVFAQSEQQHGQIVALRDLTFDVYPDEITFLLGPSGCGKSTILNLIAGFLEPTGGQIAFKGAPLLGIAQDRIVVFQTPVLFPWMTVWENAIFGVNGRHADARRICANAERILADVGLAEFRTYYPYQLSGGMRQRLQIARALAVQPEVLLLDEPFGALDAQTRFAMQELLQEIFIRYKPTIVFITHDIEEALFLGDRIYVMSARPGTIVEEIALPWGRPRTIEVFKDERFTQLKTRLLSFLHQVVQVDRPGAEFGSGRPATMSGG